MKTRSNLFPVLSVLGAALASALASPAWAAAVNQPPTALRGPIVEKAYDGSSDDLLTGGLGKTGLMGATPVFVNPAAPTPAELRRNAIYTNYRALVDYTALGGMGVFYGPNIDVNGNDTLGEGKIAGRESIAWADDGSGQQNVAMMVQVPDSFDTSKPCIVSATSSGSRGIYGAIATAGEWGLKHGCAVAYTDKGGGNGLFDPMTGTVIARDGTLTTATAAGIESPFTPALTPEQLAAFNTALPNRVAYKHAHSQQNPEKDWGKHTLDAIRFAFYVLNERYGPVDPNNPNQHLVAFKPKNTLVIASSVSNGAGAALAAAEQDTEKLIDGVAVSEPNAQPNGVKGLTIRQGSQTVPLIGKPLAEYFTFADVYQPCALLAPGLSLNAAFWPTTYTDAATQRCAALAARGLVTGATTADQANDALAQLHAHGYTPEADFLHQSHFRFATNSIAMTYVNAAGRFSVADSVCGFSFANTDAAGSVAAQNPLLQAGLFSTGNGVPPTSGVNIVYNSSVGGGKLDFMAVSPTSGQADFALDGALCLRSLVTGKDPVTGAPLTGTLAAQSQRVKAGINEVQRTAKLGKLPVIIVAGRSDALLPINHAARAYFGKTQMADAKGPNVRYIEVTNAQHFDGFIAFGALMGYDTRFIPLHVYFNRAMDAMYAKLSTGAALPPSQVVHTTPRASGAAALAASNVPPISTAPDGDAITMDGGTLVIPD
ncbi:D-(-)-3-hydroxybutyrate oligomer hydrolase [Ideonella azotifigens]|uniref:D-(-)-3-hydroxybutyrate oligomer hydrolase n=2 Tax=Ideonella azotifigens TaxID=513160 RepID=A0ABN1KJP3_9BURK|nr:3-hydroxybutyrate oligomer hydrolase family protein [Ideonella azotifigens]MCD2339464.1 D-(-)-3-hydroxybutyrate oligomer hydrolase [Ideonella azotifigens]